MQPDLSRARWKKSSYSASGNCVEVAQLGDVVAVRDSMNSTGPKIIVSEDAWRDLICRMKGKAAVQP